MAKAAKLTMGKGKMGSPVHMSMNVEKISNGYIARHSMSDGKGNYKDHTVYHPKRPKFTLAGAFSANPRIPTY